FERNLPEDGADPQGGDAEPPEVTELAGEPLQGAALPAGAGAEPHVVIDPPGIFGPIQGRRAPTHGLVRAILVAVFFVAVREAVEQQKVEDLVLPRGR